jgi:hypothetical protein
LTSSVGETVVTTANSTGVATVSVTADTYTVTVAAVAHQTTTSTTALVVDQNVVTTTQVAPIYGKNIQYYIGDSLLPKSQDIFGSLEATESPI